jgi:phage-related protein
MDIIKMARAEVRPPRPLVWMGSSKKDLLKLPSSVIDVFGYALCIRERLRMAEALARSARQ